MSEVLISADLVDLFRKWSNTNKEVGGYIIAFRDQESLRITGTGEYDEFGEDLLKLPMPSSWISQIKLANPKLIEILEMHFHSRAFGEIIQEYDPYWTLTQNEVDAEPGTTINSRFYVSKKVRKGENAGDSRVLRYFFQNSEKEVGYLINKGLFIHPSYGSEGQIMRPDLVRITCYEYDASARFGVREIPVRIVENRKV